MFMVLSAVIAFSNHCVFDRPAFFRSRIFSRPISQQNALETYMCYRRYSYYLISHFDNGMF